MEKIDKASFVRWQERTMEQLGYVVNLLMGLGIAGLGYQVNFLLNMEFTLADTEKIWVAIATLLLSASFLAGIVCTICRLRDCRLTAKISRMNQRAFARNVLRKLRAAAKAAGRCTWGLFWLQCGTFFIGVMSMGIELFSYIIRTRI
jgi:hypothetical protein